MLYITLAIFGLIFGSFATMASYRLIEGGNFLGRSFCDKCNNKLRLRELIPLLSYIFQKGKCRHCRSRISIRYPLTELASAISFAGIGFVNDTLFPIVLMMLVITALIIMIVIDFEHMIIPDEIQLTLTFLGVIYAYYHHAIEPNNYTLLQIIVLPVICVIIALLLKYLFYIFFKKDALGWGDVKFFAVAGIYLNTELLSIFFLLSGIIGVLIAIVWRCLNKGERFPFGPALACALYVCIAFPNVKNIINFNNLI